MPGRFARRFIITGCGIAILIGAVWIWWHNSNLRMVLSGKQAHMKLVGVSMGLREFWESHGHLPKLADWKDAVIENSVYQSGQPVFDSRDRLKNCFPVTGFESPWTLRGSFAEYRKRGDLLLAVCDPQSRFASDSCATAELEEGSNLAFFDAAGTRLGTLGPDATIQALYISGSVVQQTVAELGPAKER
ncbi:MAG: hypothetical protein JSS02_21805 [Planctomycetes bacterium]|nr:hypothetical protein [Planctomycetota bacterium]